MRAGVARAGRRARPLPLRIRAEARQRFHDRIARIVRVVAPFGNHALQRRVERRHGGVAVRRVDERERRRPDDLIARARDVGRVDRVGVVTRERVQRFHRRLAHVVVIVSGETLEDGAIAQRGGGARGVQPQLPHARAGELRQRRGAAFRRSRGERDERMRRAMPSARRRGVGKVSDGFLERRDRVGRRAARRELVQRGQRDVDVAIADRGERRVARVGIGSQPQRAQRFEADHRRVVHAAERQHGMDGVCRQRARRLGGAGRGRRGGAHRDPPDLRIRIARRGAEHVRRDRCRGDERLEREPPHTRADRGVGPAWRGETLEQRDRLAARRAQRPLQPRRRLQPFGNAEAIGHRLGAAGRLDERALRGVGLRRRHVREPAERLADRRADVGLGLDLEPRGQRREHGVHGRGRRRLVGSPPLRRLRDGVCGLGSDLWERAAERRKQIRDERRTLEAPERPHGDARRLIVAAAKARPDDREIARGRRAPIFGLQDREARDARRGALLRRRGKATAEHAERAEHHGLCALPDVMQGEAFSLASATLKGSPYILCGCFRSHGRRCRVAAEYSSICDARSSGYEISTSTIAPASSRTASRRGITKPV